MRILTWFVKTSWVIFGHLGLTTFCHYYGRTHLTVLLFSYLFVQSFTWINWNHGTILHMSEFIYSMHPFTAMLVPSLKTSEGVWQRQKYVSCFLLHFVNWIPRGNLMARHLRFPIKILTVFIRLIAFQCLSKAAFINCAYFRLSFFKWEFVKGDS